MDVRVQVDIRNERNESEIREAQLQKSLMVVVGTKKRRITPWRSGCVPGTTAVMPLEDLRKNQADDNRQSQ